ncbi:MAG: hypothetical protein IID30_13790 [Planctomycetes bacterium]|nr:hypothetical protein [Planctomycetota bacterium]
MSYTPLKMKLIRIILGFLLLGAIVNVAVAWGCAMWVITPPTGMQSAWVALPGLKNPKGWKVSRKKTFGATQLIAMVRNPSREMVRRPSNEIVPKPRTDNYVELDEVLPMWSGLASLMDTSAEEARRESIRPENVKVIGTVSPTVLMQKAYGFPFRSMYWNWDGGIRIANPVPRDPISNGIKLWDRPSRPGTISLDDQRALPLGVLPLGFALNAMISASLLWLLIPGPFVLRRFLRIRRGLCPKCAYNLRGSPPESVQCPECGRRLVFSESA